MTTAYDFELARPGAQPLALWDLHGQVILIVVLGFAAEPTPQVAGLDKLSRTFAPRGLTVIGVPTPAPPGLSAGTDTTGYAASFPIVAPAAHDGPDATELFAWLSAEAPGAFGTAAVTGYTKFLVGRDGDVIRRFAPHDDAGELIAAIGDALAQPVPPAPPEPLARPTPVPPEHAQPGATPPVPVVAQAEEPTSAVPEPPTLAPTASESAGGEGDPEPGRVTPEGLEDLAEPPAKGMGEELMDLSIDLYEIERETD